MPSLNPFSPRSSNNDFQRVPSHDSQEITPFIGDHSSIGVQGSESSGSDGVTYDGTVNMSSAQQVLTHNFVHSEGSNNTSSGSSDDDDGDEDSSRGGATYSYLAGTTPRAGTQFITREQLSMTDPTPAANVRTGDVSSAWIP